MSPTPPPTDPSTVKVINDVIEYGGKAAISLAAILAFVKGIAQPYVAWRKRQQAELIREVLKDELKRLDGCLDREEEILLEQQGLVARQEEMFHDLDALLDIAQDNRDRLDEINSLMDELGLASRDRREREQSVQEMVSVLIERRKARRRRLPIVPKEHEQ